MMGINIVFMSLANTDRGRQALHQIEEFRSWQFRNWVHDAKMEEISDMWSLRNSSRWV